MNKEFSEKCKKVNSSTSSVIRETAQNLEIMKKSSITEVLIEEMNFAVQELETHLRTIPASFSMIDSEMNSPENDDVKETVLTVPLAEIIPMVTFASLLTEISSRVEDIVSTVQELAEMAEFKPAAAEKQKQDQHNSTNPELSKHEKDEKTIKTLENV